MEDEKSTLHVNNGGNYYDSINQSFKLILSEEIIIPEGYNHQTQLNYIDHKDFVHVDRDITDENFKSVSHKLQPGEKYNYFLFQIVKPSWPNECVKFLNEHNFFLVGAQGETLLWQVNKKIFPFNAWVLSFDEEQALFKNPRIQCSYVPFIYHNSDGNSVFSLAFYQRLRHPNINYFIGFRNQ